jgi:hypothetical protein
MDICPYFKHTNGLIFSSLVVKRSFIEVSMKIHFMDICPCLKHTTGLIFSSLAVKRSFIGVSMKISIEYARFSNQSQKGEGNSSLWNRMLEIKNKSNQAWHSRIYYA